MQRNINNGKICKNTFQDNKSLVTRESMNDLKYFVPTVRGLFVNTILQWVIRVLPAKFLRVMPHTRMVCKSFGYYQKIVSWNGAC